MTPERMTALKQQALKAIGARAKNPAAPGISMIAISPHEALKFVELHQLNSVVDDAVAEQESVKGEGA